MWNTLIHNIPYTEPRILILKKFLLQDNIDIGSERLTEIYEHIVSKYHLSPRIQSNLHFSINHLMQEMFNYIEVPFPPAYLSSLIKEWEDIMLIQLPILKEGVKTLIPQLAQHYKIVLISDTGITPGSVIRKMFSQYNLLQYFEIMVFSDETGVKKPDQKPFQIVIDHLNCLPSEIVHVGNLRHTDILGGNQAGFHTIWFQDGYVEVMKQEKNVKNLPPDQKKFTIPDQVVQSHQDILTILKEMN